jgi:hypothetical protein
MRLLPTVLATALAFGTSDAANAKEKVKEPVPTGQRASLDELRQLAKRSEEPSPVSYNDLNEEFHRSSEQMAENLYVLQMTLTNRDMANFRLVAHETVDLWDGLSKRFRNQTQAHEIMKLLREKIDEIPDNIDLDHDKLQDARLLLAALSSNILANELAVNSTRDNYKAFIGIATAMLLLITSLTGMGGCAVLTKRERERHAGYVAQAREIPDPVLREALLKVLGEKPTKSET